MGTIAEKLTYLNGTKQALKESINNLGGDITSETTFRQYVEQLQNVYDNAPKTSYAEGTEITLSNTLKGKLDFEDGIVGIGDISQKSYQGYQMIRQASFGTFTNNGVTFTQRADGSILVNGTTTSNGASINLLTGDATVVNNDNNIAILPNQAYTLSGANDPIRVVLHTSSYSYVKNANTTFTETGNVSMSALRIIVPADTTINNVVMYPMLEKGSTAHDYEPYVGGTASPNPSYPQDIEVVRGKNLFDKDNVITGYYYNINGVLLTSQNWNVEQVEVQPNTNYYLSGNNYNNVIAGIVLLDKDKNFISLVEGYKNVHLITTTATTKYIGLSIANYSDNSDMDTLQLEKGSQATSYLPYNTLEARIRGKNKLKINDLTLTSNGVTLTFQDNYLILNGTNNGTESVFQLTNYITPFKTNSNTKLKAFQISGIASGSLVNTFFRTYSNWTNQVNVNFTQSTISSYSAELTYNNCMLALAGGTYTDYKIGIMVADNLTSDDTFEPYQTPQTYQLSLGEYEFAKIGNYVDTIEYDVDEDKVYKNEKIIKQVVTSQYISGLVAFNLQSINSYGIANFLLQNISNSEEGLYDYIGLCNYLSPQVSLIANEQNAGILYQPRNVYIRIKSTTASTNQEFKTYVDSLNTSGNPLIIYRPTSTPTKTEITGTLKDQIKALYYSHSFTGTTILEVDGDLPLIIKTRALKGE